MNLEEATKRAFDVEYGECEKRDFESAMEFERRCIEREELREASPKCRINNEIVALAKRHWLEAKSEAEVARILGVTEEEFGDWLVIGSRHRYFKESRSSRWSRLWRARQAVQRSWADGTRLAVWNAASGSFVKTKKITKTDSKGNKTIVETEENMPIDHRALDRMQNTYTDELQDDFDELTPKTERVSTADTGVLLSKLAGLSEAKALEEKDQNWNTTEDKTDE